MSDVGEHIRLLLGEADAAGEGPAQVALIEEAVRLADARGEGELAFAVRKRLFLAAVFASRCDLAGVTFAWCLSWLDARPGRPVDPQMLWDYRRVVTSLSNFPEVSRAELLAMIDDMGRRFAAAGRSPRRIELTRMQVASDFGDVELARAARAAWGAAPRDDLGVDPGWDELFDAESRRFVGDDAGAVAIIDEYLTRRHAEPRALAFAAGIGLMPLVRLGRPADAAAAYRRLVGWERPPAGTAWHWSERLRFLAATGNAGAGVGFFAKTLPRVFGQVDPLGRLHYALAALSLFATLDGRGRMAAVLPADAPPYRPDGRYDPAALRDWLRAESAGLAARFDARNGNDFFARKAAEAEAVRVVSVELTDTRQDV